MNEFKLRYTALLEELGDHKKMVLSTSLHDHVTSRMMSLILTDGRFYFQTDTDFRKSEQIRQNPRVSLCWENIQLEGVCSEIGHPTANQCFCELFEKYYPGSFRYYTHLDSERLFVIAPTYIKKWVYDDKIPYTEVFDVAKENYMKTAYKSV